MAAENQLGSVESRYNGVFSVKGWLQLNDSNTVIVFVHGLFSDSKSCWTSKCGTFWPKLLLEDQRISTPSIFLAEFYTQPGSNDYGIQECAKEVYQSLLREDKNRNAPPIKKEKIVFVAHSTGGVISRYMLEAYSDSFVGKQIGLCLFASPSYGSKISIAFGFFARLFNNKLAQELRWGSHILQDLDGRFAALLHSKKLNITGMEAIENRAPFNIPFLKERVVEATSAARYFGNRRIIPASDHSSIVKPTDLDSDSHQALFDFLVSDDFCVKRASFTYPSLFDRYTPELDRYYIHRTSDDELASLLSRYCLWVFGEPGTGKTAAITRALSRQLSDVQYISLGACIGESAQDLIKVIHSHLCDCAAEEGDCSRLSDYIDSTARSIAARCKRNSNFCLFIEEIPIVDQKMFLEFSNYIYLLTTAINSADGFRLVLSSVYKPNVQLAPELQKITERLKVAEWDLWNPKDIERLVEVISADTGLHLAEKILSDGRIDNPRMVKNYYRDALSKRVKGK